jgi:hypothetical protein
LKRRTVAHARAVSVICGTDASEANLGSRLRRDSELPLFDNLNANHHPPTRGLITDNNSALSAMIFDMATKAKDPLAVAFAKRYAAKRSPEARAAAAANLTAWRKNSTIQQRRAIARKGAYSRLNRPDWLSPSPASSPPEPAVGPSSPPAAPPEAFQAQCAVILADNAKLDDREFFDRIQALLADFRAK